MSGKVNVTVSRQRKSSTHGVKFGSRRGAAVRSARVDPTPRTQYRSYAEGRMFTINRKWAISVVMISACAVGGASCSSSSSPAGGSGGTTSGSGGAAAGSGGVPAGTGGASAETGGATADSGSVELIENDAGQLILPLPVLDPTGTYAGKTYAEWDAAWWQRWMGLPGPEGVFDDTTGAFCAVGQSAAADGGATQTDVFFLGTGASGKQTLSCTIPLGEMLFVPLITSIRDNAGVPEGTLTDDQLRGTLKAQMGEVAALALEIDGKSYGSKVSDFASYLTLGTQFSYTVPDTPTNFPEWCPSCFGVATFSGAVPKSFCAGYEVLLAPLSAGSHTIRTVSQPPSSPIIDITYNLTVQ